MEGDDDIMMSHQSSRSMKRLVLDVSFDFVREAGRSSH
jgi:hypothetical protein